MTKKIYSCDTLCHLVKEDKKRSPHVKWGDLFVEIKKRWTEKERIPNV